MELTAQATKDGNLNINGNLYKLQSKIGVFVTVFVNNIVKKNDNTWVITATFGPKTVTEEIPKDAILTIERELGNDEIILKGPKSTKKLVKMKKNMNENLIKINSKAIEKIVKRVIEEQENQRYMFFSNLEQIKRQCELLLNQDKNMIESILDDGHDWAQDHIAEAKNNLDQVFDFLMNESKKDGETSEEEVMLEGRKKTGTKLCSRGKSAAKVKFKVYPSAYANGYAVQVCKGKMPGTDGKKKCSAPYC